MGYGLRSVASEEIATFLEATETSFGFEARDDDIENLKRVLEPARTLAAFDGDAIVGTAGAFSFDLTVPGGELPAAGVTLVGVLPSHRRRGILSQMMKHQLDDIQDRGEPLAILWASEGAIYERFGYGLATRYGRFDIERPHARFKQPREPHGRWRIISLNDAAEVLPPVYDEVRRATPGMYARSAEWWKYHRLPDPEHHRDGGGPMFCAVHDTDGRADGYALYRIHASWEEGLPNNRVSVREAMGTSPAALEEVWRYLFGIDLVSRIEAWFLPAEHPLFLTLIEPRRLRFGISDSLWLRVIDLPKALEGRAFDIDDSIVLAVTDRHCPWNEGTWQLETAGGRGRVERSSREADVSLDIWDLGTVYLGGFTFSHLLQAGRLAGSDPEAVKRADRIFHTHRSPWCPEIF